MKTRSIPKIVDYTAVIFLIVVCMGLLLWGLIVAPAQTLISLVTIGTGVAFIYLIVRLGTTRLFKDRW